MTSVVAAVGLAVVDMAVVVVDRSIRIRTRVMGAGDRSDSEEQECPETGVAHRVASVGDWRRPLWKSKWSFVPYAILCPCASVYTHLLSVMSPICSLVSTASLNSHCHHVMPTGFSFFVLVLVRSISLLQILVISLFFLLHLLLLVDGHSLSKSARLPSFLFSCSTGPSSLILVFASSRTVSVKQYAR